MSEPLVKAWRCLVCGYVHRGDEPPEVCPVCGAPSSEFEPFTEEPAPRAAAPARSTVGRVVIVGAGIAGVSAAESVRQTAPDASITLISYEDELPYYRLNLTRLLAGEIGDAALPIHPPAWYEEQRVDLVRGAEAERIDLDARKILLRDARTLEWDRLILAAGASPFVPPFPGAHLDGVRSLRTASDARAIVALARPGLRVVCIGGGILGLETAGALARRGADVTLLESHGFLMPRQLNQRAGELLGRYVEGVGIRLVRQARTKAIQGSERAEAVELEDGSRWPADLVIVATGVRSNTRLAREAGLALQQGVLVDNFLTTSHEDVFAAGDVAEHRGVLYGSWYAAQYQGSIAGMNAAGAAVEFGGLPRSHTLKVLGLEMTSIGLFEPPDADARVVEDEAEEAYRRFVLQNSRLVGGVLLGDTRLAAALSKAVEQGAVFQDVPADATAAAVVARQLTR